MPLIKINFAFFLFLVSNVVFGYVRNNSILVCYGKLNPNQIIGYSYVILESHFYSIYEIQKIKSQNEKVIAYISLGEINSNSIYIDRLKPYSYGKNENWNSFYLDLYQPETKTILLSIIDQTLSLGFDGMFFDNIDNFSSYGPQSEQKQLLIDFLKVIRETFPNHFFIQNSGIQLVDETAPFINAFVMESIASDYSFDKNTYQLRDEKEFSDFSKALKAINKTHDLPILLIEYADNLELFDAIETRIKKLRFDYFIGNINLQTIPQFLN